MVVNVINKSKNALPEYSTIGSAGMDVRADFDSFKILPAHHRALIPTGLYVSIPEGYEIQVRPRSGLALKHGITVLNTPGTVDSDFRGNIGVILMNTSDEDFVIEPGDRIAQIVLNKYEKIEWNEVDNLDETVRGEGGYNSTGVK